MEYLLLCAAGPVAVIRIPHLEEDGLKTATQFPFCSNPLLPPDFLI